MLSALYAIAHPSVRQSVCPSVTRVDQSKTVELRGMQFSPYSSPKSSSFCGVSFIKKFGRVPPERGRQTRVGNLTVASCVHYSIRDVFIRYSLDGAVIVRHGVFL